MKFKLAQSVLGSLWVACMFVVCTHAHAQTQVPPPSSRSHAGANQTESSGNDSAPECRLAKAPAFCKWSREKLQQAELKMVDDMRKKLEIEFKWLKPKGLMGSSYAYHFQPTDPDYVAYCNSKLQLIRDKQYEIFPKPDAKSSEVGLDVFGQMWLQSMQIPPQRSTTEGLVKAYLAGKRMDPKDKNHRYASSHWLYRNRLGYSLIDFVHAQKYIVASSVEYHDVATTRGDNSTSASAASAKETITPFITGAFGIVNIAGEAFHVTAGTLHWTGYDINSWDLQWVINRPEFNECDERENCTSRVMVLHPIDAPPWVDWIRQRGYRDSQRPPDQHAAEQLRNHACQWWIE